MRGQGRRRVEEEELQSLAVEGEREGAEKGWREGGVHLHASSQGEGGDHGGDREGLTIAPCKLLTVDGERATSELVSPRPAA